MDSNGTRIGEGSIAKRLLKSAVSVNENFKMVDAKTVAVETGYLNRKLGANLNAVTIAGGLTSAL